MKTLAVSNADNLTICEKQAILVCFTANETFNSFAAEVQFHADAIYDWKSAIDKWYGAALRADMTVGEDTDSGEELYDEYYDLTSDLVQAQIAEHGEY